MAATASTIAVTVALGAPSELVFAVLGSGESVTPSGAAWAAVAAGVVCTAAADGEMKSVTPPDSCLWGRDAACSVAVGSAAAVVERAAVMLALALVAASVGTACVAAVVAAAAAVVAAAGSGAMLARADGRHASRRL